MTCSMVVPHLVEGGLSILVGAECGPDTNQ
jgi:hypothetical protein